LNEQARGQLAVPHNSGAEALTVDLDRTTIATKIGKPASSKAEDIADRPQQLREALAEFLRFVLELNGVASE
jgi:hypothetical protein